MSASQISFFMLFEPCIILNNPKQFWSKRIYDKTIVNPIDFSYIHTSSSTHSEHHYWKMQQDCPFQEGKISHQKVIDENGLPFPIVLLPQDNKEEFNTLQSFLHTIQNNRDWINDHLKKVGALVFRGFPVKTASDFNMVMEAFGWEEKSYDGPASRTRIEGRVYTANEGLLHQPINFHHEMALVSF